MPTIKFEGLADIEKKLAKNIKLDAVKKVIKKNGEQLQKKAQRNAKFKGHYEWEKGKGKVFKKPTGKLKGSIELDIKNGGLEAEVEPTAKYAAYVELGTRFMDAQPYLKPAYDEQIKQFKNDIQKLVK